MDLVTVKGLSKRYGGIVALSDATFSARAGEVHALLGENGAGKSTFIQILSGAVRHDGGSILVDGQDYRPANPDVAQARGIAAVFQELSLSPTSAWNRISGSATSQGRCCAPSTAPRCAAGRLPCSKGMIFRRCVPTRNCGG